MWFGIFASLAVIAGVWYAHRVAQQEFQGGDTLLDMAPWFLFPGFLGAHVASVVFYYPEALRQGGIRTLFNVTSGLSSFGGLLAGALGAYVFARRHGLPVLPWLDVLARSFSLSFVFGRAGCSIVHDHPGLPTDFFLAMTYPSRDGFPAGRRHDLGFYEFLLWVVIFAVFHRLGRRRRADGFYIGLLIVFYAPVRFGLDFLRTNDPIYSGLTFAQWCCLLVFPVGIWLMRRVLNSGECPAPAERGPLSAQTAATSPPAQVGVVPDSNAFNPADRLPGHDGAARATQKARQSCSSKPFG